MAEWKKIIVSGSTAELSKIVVDGHVSASLFSGSFVGDGSGITGLFQISGDTNNRVITADGSGGGVGEANLTFDGSTLTVTGAASITGNTTLGDASGDTVTINGETVKLVNVPAGTDNTVLVLNGENNIVTDEIDSRVWGTTLIDGSLTSGRVPYASDANTITDSTNLTFNGTTLTANTATITNDLTVGGDLIVQGTTIELQVTNLNVEDQFILLNSGSTGADTGIVFGGAAGGANQGAALYFDINAERLTYIAEGVSANATTANHVGGGYVTVAYDTDTAGQTAVAAVGNIKIEGGEAFIYA